MELPLFFLSTLHFMFMEITCTILASGHKPNCIARTLTTVTTQRHNLGMRDVMFPAQGLESVLESELHHFSEIYDSDSDSNSNSNVESTPRLESVSTIVEWAPVNSKRSS